MSPPIEFTPAQRAAMVAQWQRIAEEAPPFNPRPYGCLTVIAGMALFFLIPQLGFKLPQPWGQVLGWGLAILMLAGAAVGIFFGSGVHGRAAQRAQKALDALVAEAIPENDLRLHHAVELIAYAVVSDGPTTASVLDIDAAKQQLGTRLDYVIAVERVLSTEIGALAVFSGSGEVK